VKRCLANTNNTMTAKSILDLIGNTPMVELGRLGAGLPVPVLGKCEFMNPGGSVKDRIALAIVDDAERRGVLRPGMTLIEATAGNTGVGLLMVAVHRGYRLVCVMPEKMSVDKREGLAALGAEVIVTQNAPLHDPKNFRRVAERLARENGWFLADQFANPANPKVHEETTGPEIFRQCEGRVGGFVCGVGTGGTITGVGKYLKKQGLKTRIVLADPVGSRLSHLVDSRHPDHDAAYQVEGIGGSEPPRALDLSVVDDAERVSDEESFAMAGRLMREEGLLVGGSSGTAVVAALRVAARGNVDGPVVVILADSWDRYYSKPWFRGFAEIRQPAVARIG
jgi:cystathionine beta-synthase